MGAQNPPTALGPQAERDRQAPLPLSSGLLSYSASERCGTWSQHSPCLAGLGSSAVGRAPSQPPAPDTGFCWTSLSAGAGRAASAPVPGSRSRSRWVSFCEPLRSGRQDLAPGRGSQPLPGWHPCLREPPAGPRACRQAQEFRSSEQERQAHTQNTRSLGQGQPPPCGRAGRPGWERGVPGERRLRKPGFGLQSFLTTEVGHGRLADSIRGGRP